MKMDMSLNNAALYKGCEVSEVGGRLTLLTPPSEAANIIGRNARKMVEAEQDRSAITLSGAMAIWAYLIVFHQVVHSFTSVVFDDGRTPAWEIARH